MNEVKSRFLVYRWNQGSPYYLEERAKSILELYSANRCSRFECRYSQLGPIPVQPRRQMSNGVTANSLMQLPMKDEGANRTESGARCTPEPLFIFRGKRFRLGHQLRFANVFWGSNTPDDVSYSRPPEELASTKSPPSSTGSSSAIGNTVEKRI